ncbi:HAMP domain-containing histidine kinase [Burkholderiaceae bacterium DAT-1]|nr:HAMP domain-containing histidine kinase [Burkholderiaceae bacterium DAT-1]
MLTISRRVGGLVTLAVVAIGVTGLFGLIQLNRVDKQVRKLNHEATPLIISSAELGIAFKTIPPILISQLNETDTFLREGFSRKLHVAEQQLQDALNARKRQTHPDAMASHDELMYQLIQQYIQAMHQALEYTRAGNSADAFVVLYSTILPLNDKIDELLRQDREAGKHAQQQGEANIDDTFNHVMTAYLGIGLFSMIMLSVSGWLLYRRIVHPVHAMQTTALDIVSSQDFSRRMPVYELDEVGETSLAFNCLLDNVVEAKSSAETALDELKSTQASLVEAEKMSSLGGLVAGVAHEINTPLGIALTCSTHLHEASKTIHDALTAGSLRKADLQSFMDDALESTQLIHNNTNRAASLVQSFKQVAVDQASEAPRIFDLEQYLQEILTSLGPRVRKAHAWIILQVETPVSIHSYPGAFAQVITNLVINALVHGLDDREGGEIRIVATQSAEWVTLDVSDNGRGIPQEHIGKIFEPFFTTKRGQGGSGLGLHIVYNIMRNQLGGDIKVESTQQAGTVFHLSLPVTAPNLAEAGAFPLAA